MKNPFKINLGFGEDEEELELEKEEVRPEPGEKPGRLGFLLPLGIFLLALLPRLYFLFFVSGVQNAGPGWYGDVYHHWQIAYLSKEIGFKEGFLRLWDLKGMEYFWGLLHPLVLSFLFTLTGSVDILVPRLLAIFSGAAIVTLLFLLARRSFGTLTATAVAIWAAFFPVVLYSDTLGMQDQLALFLLLLGIYFWPKRPITTGLLFGLAGMGRAEYWVFGLGLIIAAALIERKFDKTFAVFASWLVVSLFYMKYLLDKTGNPIYPVWWNFLGNVMGEWQEVKPLSAAALLGKRVFQGLFVVGVLGAVFTFWKKPKSYLFFLLGFGTLLFNGLFFGFSAYIYGWVNRYYVDRLLNLPYTFLGFLLSALFIYFLGQKIKLWARLKLGILVVLTILVGFQFLWSPIRFYFKLAQDGWPTEVELARRVVKHYQGGKILIPENRAPFTYALVRLGGIKGENIVGEMFDPYYYMEPDPYQNWPKNREKVLSWLRSENIKLLAFYPGTEKYERLIKSEPQYFEFKTDTGILLVYQIKGL